MDGQTEVGVLAAFLLYLRRFFEPMQELSPCSTTRCSRRRPRWRSCPACSTRRRPSPSRADAACRCRRRPPRRGRPSTGVTFAYRDDRPCCPARPAHPGRADGRAGRRDRRRQDHDRQAGRPLLRPDRRRGRARRRRPARPVRGRPAPRGRHGDPGELPVLRHGRREHPLRPARRRRASEIEAAAAGDRRGPASSGRCPTATTPTSASAAAGCRPGSGSWSRSPGRSSPTRRC